MIIPQSDKWQEAAAAWAAKEEIGRKNEREIQDFRQKLREESGEKAMEDEWFSLLCQAETETRQLHSQFLQEVYEGKHGRGELFLVYGNGLVDSPKHVPMKVRRMLYIGEEGPNKKVNIAKKRAVGERELDYYDRIYWRTQPKDLSSSYNMEQGKLSYIWAEVGLDEVQTSQAELEQFFEYLKHRCSIGSLMEAFPKGFRPPVEAGEILSLGSCTHHSGDIYCYGIVLSTGRLAVVTDYEGECKIGPDVEFHGVAADPRWRPDLSASWKELRNSDELLLPTREEVDFLRGKKVEIDEEFLLEESVSSVSGEEAA